MSLRAAAAFLALAGASGCSGCHGDHPYVPFTIGSAETSAASVPEAAASAATASPGAADAGEPTAEAATLAPAGLSRWGVQGVTLEAPPQRVFLSAVVRDFDGDGAKDAFAIVRPPEGNDPGELVFFHGGPGQGSLAPAATFPPPAEVARAAAACPPMDRLSAAGPRAVLVELGASCPAAPAGAPDRWFAVVAAGAAARVRLAATVTDPPGAPALSVDAETADRDGDGLPDLTLRVSLEGGGAPFEPGPRVSATVAWLDRPAGLARDTAAVESSFASLASSAMSKARSSREAPGVPALVEQARALWRSMCTESGAPRVVGVAGTGGVACGVGSALEQLGLAEARAYATMGDALRTVLAIDRAERAPAARTRSRLREAQKWVASLAPIATARSVRSVAAVPQVPRGHEPAWGPLAFEPGGKLLVRTGAGVVRVDPDAGDETAAAGVAAWPSAVTSPDGSMQWIETYDPCDALALHATFAPASGDDVRDLALPVAPALGDRCNGSRGAPAHATPVAWGPGGLEALVEGEPILVAPDLALASPLASFLDAPVAAGAPRSPDGRTLVLPTSLGLLVRGPTRARLLRAPGLDGTYADQHDCAVSDDGTHVACVHGESAWVASFEAGE